MKYNCVLYNSIKNCPARDWENVCQITGAEFFMNVPYLSIIEEVIANQSAIWHIIVYNDRGAAVACANLCCININLTTLAGKWVKQIGSIFSKMANVKILSCGLPFSAIKSNLLICPGEKIEKIVTEIERTLLGLASNEKANAIVFQNFLDEDETVKLLFPLGYRAAESPASYEFRGNFKDFNAYCDALKSHYRSDINKSRRKINIGSFRCSHILDAETILKTYNTDLHELYRNVARKSVYRLDILPIEFFHKITKEFQGAISLTLIYKNEAVVAFSWGLFKEKIFYCLFCGLNYSRNSEADLYFNLMFQQLDYALSLTPSIINLGRTADLFKLRLGCRRKAQRFYIKPVGFMATTILRTMHGIIFKNPKVTNRYNIYKS